MARKPTDKQLCSDRDGGRYYAEVANGRGYYDASGKFHYHHVPNDEW